MRLCFQCKSGAWFSIYDADAVRAVLSSSQALSFGSQSILLSAEKVTFWG
jgi:hypothetical protein